MQSLFKKVADYFCFDPKKKTMEEFFGEMDIFRTDYVVMLIVL